MGIMKAIESLNDTAEVKVAANIKFKTLRHIETVRNFIGAVIKNLLTRSENHDQSKLQSPEVEVFDSHTGKLRGSTFGSAGADATKLEMKDALDHHYQLNRHHPEHFENGIDGMNLIDLLEMMCDWKASSLRHDDGNIMQSIKINQKRFGYSDELAGILINTASWLNEQEHQIVNYANES